MKILLIEDHEILARNLKEGLEMERYIVDVAHDGLTGLSMAGENCDLIILDLMIPKLSGEKFIEEFRKYNTTTPILILSAKDLPEEKVNALDLGGDDYIVKPFSLDELYARIRTLLRRSTSKELELVVDNLILNPKTKTVTRAGKDISLSSKEYSLLEYLMRNKGNILSESDIISHTWSYDYEGMSNIVAVYIRYLRNKIDKAFPEERQIIETVRGRGYKVVG